MFFFWAFTSMLAYATQDILLVKYARKIDGLSLAIYRNLSFVLTLLPLLLFTSVDKIQETYLFAPQIILSGITGACSVWLTFSAFRYLPVGILSSLTKSITVIGLTLLSFIFFQETISLQTFCLMCLILGSIVYLGIQKNHMRHLEKRTSLGFLFAILASFAATTSIFLVIKTSRELNPFVAGYFWETSIGLFALIIGLIRSFFTKHKLQIVDLKTMFKIGLAASPTLLGTGAFAFAVTLGPVGVVSTIGATSIIVISILAHLLYKEQLFTKQWLGILMVTFGIIALKITT